VHAADENRFLRDYPNGLSMKDRRTKSTCLQYSAKIEGIEEHIGNVAVLSRPLALARARDTRAKPARDRAPRVF